MPRGLAVLREQPVRPIHAGGFHGRGQPGGSSRLCMSAETMSFWERKRNASRRISRRPTADLLHTGIQQRLFSDKRPGLQQSGRLSRLFGPFGRGELPDAPNGLRRAGRLGGRGGGSSVFRASFAYPHLHGNGSSQAEPKRDRRSSQRRGGCQHLRSYAPFPG